MAASFYSIVLLSRDTGNWEQSRTFSTVAAARKFKRHCQAFSDAVRIMRGGPGVVEVQ